MKKLIIWDFDGVIADTEKLWVENRLYFLRRDYGVDWDFGTAYKYIGGISERDKARNLKNLGLDIKDSFWQNSFSRDYETLTQVTLTPHIEEIFNLKEFDQCIATGGLMERTMKKVKQTGVDKYFTSDRIFTADMVKNGKPEPDIFLLAAKKMGYELSDIMVIEDSVAGVMAAQKAGINVIVFSKYNTAQINALIEDLHPDFMVDDMRNKVTYSFVFYRNNFVIRCM